MGILSMFKKKDAVQKASTIAPDISNEGDLDFLSAIEAHIRWKIRLEAYVSGTSEEDLDAVAVSSDRNCVLGKWLHHVGGEKHGDHELFHSLVNTHAHFHQCAGRVVNLTDAGDVDAATNLLRRGDYCKYSNQVKAELARLSLEIEHHV